MKISIAIVAIIVAESILIIILRRQGRESMNIDRIKGAAFYICGEAPEARTLNRLIKSQLLYLLS